jgi:hypothetical protein
LLAVAAVAEQELVVEELVVLEQDQDIQLQLEHHIQ